MLNLSSVVIDESTNIVKDGLTELTNFTTILQCKTSKKLCYA